MSEYKKQHYVPKFYMQLFASQQKMFSVYNLASKKILPSVPYGSHCYKDYYYGKDGVWENRLSEMETMWAHIIKRVLSKSLLTEEDIVALKKFALYQRQRTMAEENYSKQVRKELLIEYSKTICANKGYKYDADVINEFCSKRANESITPAEMLQYAEQYLDYIKDLHTVVIEYNTKTELFSSDVPVILINPFHQQTVGYSCMGLIMLFPISPHHIIVFYDKKMYPKYVGKLYVELNNEKEVVNLNILQFTSADKILFSKTPDAFTKLNIQYWNTRDRNRNTKNIHTLGTNEKKLIGTFPRTTIYDCIFSFGKIHHDFLSIPYPCREAVPRVWEKEWEEKLNMKADLIFQIACSKRDIITKMGRTKKELRHGYKQMAKSAKKYWQIQ